MKVSEGIEKYGVYFGLKTFILLNVRFFFVLIISMNYVFFLNFLSWKSQFYFTEKDIIKIDFMLFRSNKTYQKKSLLVGLNANKKKYCPMSQKKKSFKYQSRAVLKVWSLNKGAKH